MGMFGQGFGKRLLGGIDAMTQRWGEMNGDPGALARLRGQEEAAAFAREQAQRQATPQGVNLGSGGFATWSPADGLNILRTPERLEAAPKPTPLEQQIEYIRKLNPKLTPVQLAQIAERGVAGYGYSPEAIGVKEQSALRVKAAPTYAGLHPRASGGAGGAPKTLKPGDQFGGHTYLGGDPHNQASWR